jgi:hypothetical protein
MLKPRGNSSLFKSAKTNDEQPLDLSGYIENNTFG